jgi:hypothetical protein
MAPQPLNRYPDYHLGGLVFRHPLGPKSSSSPPPATQEAESAPQANVATLDTSASNEQVMALAIRAKPKPRLMVLPHRMSQTSGISKNPPNKFPSTPALAQRIEHSLAVAARLGDISNISISEARPSFSREAAPSVEAPPSRTTAAPRKPRGRNGANGRWRAGDASDAVPLRTNPTFAPVLAARQSRKTVAPINPRERNPRFRTLVQSHLTYQDEATSRSTARRGELNIDRNCYLLIQIHRQTPADATVAGSSVDVEMDVDEGEGEGEGEQPVTKDVSYAGYHEDNRRKSGDNSRADLKAHQWGKRQCAGCRQRITVVRYECRGSSEDFDLCTYCFQHPAQR